MILPTIGMAVLYSFLHDATDVKNQTGGSIYYQTNEEVFQQNQFVGFPNKAIVKPKSEKAFRNIVRQQYDYSCGSAALTTLLNAAYGKNLTEKAVLDGMLKYGEYDKIISRRSFSLLDMKRYVNSLGLDSGGFRAQVSDIMKLNTPVIVPIDYGGSKHFVVVKGIQDGRIFLADPSIGNISFPISRFEKIWDNNTLFKIGNPMQGENLLAIQEKDLEHVEDGLLADWAYLAMDFPQRSLEMQRDESVSTQLLRNSAANADNDLPRLQYQPLRMYYQQK